jgi:tRNA (Thr-GGU) A37 N-methylase
LSNPKDFQSLFRIQDVDIVDETSLLDIKPCVPEFDIREVERIGWLEKKVHKLWMMLSAPGAGR